MDLRMSSETKFGETAMAKKQMTFLEISEPFHMRPLTGQTNHVVVIAKTFALFCAVNIYTHEW